EAYGTCDEANSMIGQALSFLNEAEWEGKADFLKKLYRVQTILFHVGAELSTPKDREVAWKLKESHITELEEQIDDWSETLDRKSTRLNSSHVSISYAVFCLKKKKMYEKENQVTAHDNATPEQGAHIA